MAPKLKIPGTSSDRSAKEAKLAEEKISSLPFTITVQETVDVTSSARAAGGAVTVELTQPPDEWERQTGEVCTPPMVYYKTYFQQGARHA